MTDTERLIILNMVEGLGSIRTKRLLEHFGSFKEIFNADEKELKKAKDIGPIIASKIVRSIKEINLDKELRLIGKHGVRVITFLDKDYPNNLKNIHDPPVVLYVKGEIIPQDSLAVAIVGSRLASFYGVQTAERIAFELASRGITIISGLARGIDSRAHRGAIKARGRTIAVLGSGIAYIYPEEHIDLADEIYRDGAVISEFPMGTIPDRENFPKRNRIISGLSLGVVIVEASERSGALITADCALEQGREVFAVPGKVDSATSKGTNKLIQQGARLATGVDDILEELDLGDHMIRWEDRPEVSLSNEAGSRLDKNESLVYNLLSTEPLHIDELCERAKLGITEISKILFDLEMKKFVRELPGKNFVKRTD